MREQRVIDELERLRRDKTGWGGVDCTTLSGQLEEAQGELCTLRGELSKYEEMVSELQGQQEEYQLEKEERRAELDLMRAKVRRLERDGMKVSGVETEESQGGLGVDSPSVGESHTLNARAPTFLQSVSVPVSSAVTTVVLSPSTSMVYGGTSPTSTASAL